MAFLLFLLFSLLLAIVPAAIGADTNVPEILKEGFALQQAAAAALESGLEKQPDDERVRVTLIGYYSHRPAGIAAESIRERRAAHILWMIEKHPESTLFEYETPAWKIFVKGENVADPVAFERGAALWKSHLANHPNDEKLQRHAAAFLQLGDAAEAAELYRRIKESRGVGTTYARYLLGVVALDPITGEPTALEETQRSSELAQQFLADLESSKNSELMGSAGSELAVSGAMLYAAGKTNWDYSVLAVKLLEAARKLDRKNTEWWVVPTTLPARGEMTPRIIRLSWDLVKRAQTKSIAPKYPSPAKQSKIQDTIWIDAAIGTDGKVMKTLVVSGHPALADAAAEAVSKWEFKPIRMGDRPLIVLTRTQINFTITVGPPQL
ncbi:MAG: energy transducer TonB [Pirellulales bacterium]